MLSESSSRKNNYTNDETLAITPLTPTTPTTTATTTTTTTTTTTEAPTRTIALSTSLTLSGTRRVDGDWWDNSYILDWLIIAVYLSIAFVIRGVEPTNRYVFWCDYSINYPTHDQVITGPVNVLICCSASVLILAVFFYLQRSVHELHHSCLGLFHSVSTAYLIGQALTAIAGEQRPDYVDQCSLHSEDLQVLYQVCASGSPVNWNNEELMLKFPYGLECQDDVSDASRSFIADQPLVASAFGFYLSLYLAGKLRLFAGRITLAKVLVCFGPFYYAIVMALEVIAENRNHPSDTLYALGLGILCATISYILTFEWLFSINPSIIGLPLNRLSPSSAPSPAHNNNPNPNNNNLNNNNTRSRSQYENIDDPR